MILHKVKSAIKMILYKAKCNIILYYMSLVLSLILFVRTYITNIRFWKFRKIAKFSKKMENYEYFKHLRKIFKFWKIQKISQTFEIVKTFAKLELFEIIWNIMENFEKFENYWKFHKIQNNLKKKSCLKMTPPGGFPSSCLLSHGIPLLQK